MSVRSKLENIWYHYKSYIIVSLFLIGTVIFALHSCVTKSEYDIQVYYVAGSSSLYQEQLDWIEGAVAAQCGDMNGDGEVHVAVTGLRVGQYSDASTRAQYMNAVQAGEVMLLFGDQAGIEYLHENGYLRQIADFTDQTVADGYAWQVNNTPFAYSFEGFEMFSDVDLYISLRVFDDTWSAATEAGQENYDVACNTFRNILSCKATYDLRICCLTAEKAMDGKMLQWVRKAVESSCKDYNGDGSVVVEVTSLDLSNSATLDKYIHSLAGDARLYFGDGKAMEILMEKGCLRDLSNLSDRLSYNGYAWHVNGSGVAESISGFDAFGQIPLYMGIYPALNEDASGAEAAGRAYETLLSLLRQPAVSE